jgi:hypothetical protein
VQYVRALLDAKMFDQAISELKVCALYPGKHQAVIQRLLRVAQRERTKQLKELNRSTPVPAPQIAPRNKK